MDTVKPIYRTPKIFSGYGNVIAAESTRHGGVSEAPYHSLNLGGATGDSPEKVMENNHRFFGALGVPFEHVAKSHQVHGAGILNVIQAGRFDGYDALITNQPEIQLAVTIADCTPILIYDPVSKAAAAIHAGWRGTVQQIVSKTIVQMQQHFGSAPANCLAYIGTCIDQCSFEVGQDVADHFNSSHKMWDAQKQKFFIDLKQANKDQLFNAGLSAEKIEVSTFSTVIHNDDYFSYRHENGLTGRMLATIGFSAS
jgi:YfiH family protein